MYSPPVEWKLELGRALTKARLAWLVQDLNGRVRGDVIALGETRGMLTAACRANADLGDQAHVSKMLAEIEGGGRWLHVRDILERFLYTFPVMVSVPSVGGGEARSSGGR